MSFVILGLDRGEFPVHGVFGIVTNLSEIHIYMLSYIHMLGGSTEPSKVCATFLAANMRIKTNQPTKMSKKTAYLKSH